MYFGYLYLNVLLYINDHYGYKLYYLEYFVVCIFIVYTFFPLSVCLGDAQFECPMCPVTKGR